MALFTIEDHGELTGVGQRSHDEIDAALTTQESRLQKLEAKRWYRFEATLVAAMVDTAVEDSLAERWAFNLPLGSDPEGNSLSYRDYEHLNIFICGMQQTVGQAILLTPQGDSIWVVLPEQIGLWARYRSGLMPLVLEWFK